MFVVVTVDTIASPNYLARILPFRRAKITTETLSVEGTSVAYLHLDSVRHVDWLQIERMTGGLSSRLVVSKLVELPDRAGLGTYHGKRFHELTAMNTAISLLEESQLPFYSLSLGIIDLSGTHGNLAEIAVKHIPSIKIYTEFTERLEPFCAAMLEQYGAPVILTEELASLGDCPLILAFDLIDTQEFGNRFPYILYPCKAELSTYSRSVQIQQPKMPEHLNPLCPDDIDPGDFLAALYEINRCAVLRQCKAESFFCKGEEVTMEELAKRIFVSGSKMLGE